MKEMLKSMKETLISQTQSQVANLKEADCKELGEAIDMIKDLEEALYYCTIIEAMEKKDEEKGGNNYYYTESKYIPVYDEYYRDMDRPYGRMYYGGGNGSSGSSNGGRSMGGNNSGTSYYGGRDSAENSQSAWGNEGKDGRMNYGTRYMYPYHEYEYPVTFHDPKEGRSPMSRKQYMESKELHQDKAKQLRDLEQYMQELTSDIAEMIEDATPEEKQLLQKKISSLATKIDQLK